MIDSHNITKLSNINFLNRIYSYKDKINNYFYFTNKKLRLLYNFSNKKVNNFLSLDSFTDSLYTPIPYKISEKNYFYIRQNIFDNFINKKKTDLNPNLINTLNTFTVNTIASHQITFSNKFFILYKNIITSSSLLIIFSNTYNIFNISDLIL